MTYVRNQRDGQTLEQDTWYFKETGKIARHFGKGTQIDTKSNIALVDPGSSHLPLLLAVQFLLFSNSFLGKFVQIISLDSGGSRISQRRRQHQEVLTYYLAYFFSQNCIKMNRIGLKRRARIHCTSPRSAHCGWRPTRLGAPGSAIAV